MTFPDPPDSSKPRQSDPDGGATCLCGVQFSFNVWLTNYWQCLRCGRMFRIGNEDIRVGGTS